ncbi:MAG: hypothetical protein LVQ95_05750 [Candidatus Micrarchaeales archaeon]|nr:hypothetical protein [Candidatus Micrarchaeales archaeon]
MERSSGEGPLKDSDRGIEADGSAMAAILAKRALETAPVFLSTLIGREKTLNVAPQLSLQNEAGKAGSHRIGSDTISVGIRDPYRAAAHEYFHFYQSKSGFAQLALHCNYFSDSLHNEELANGARLKLAHAVLEAGAYFFEAALVADTALRNQRCEEATINTLSQIRNARDLRYNMALVTNIQTMLRMNQPQLMVEEVEKLAEANAHGTEAGCASTLQITSTALGRGMAILVFAANDFDARPAIAVLDSNPWRIMSCIRGMNKAQIESVDWMLRGREQCIESIEAQRSRMIAEDFVAAFSDRQLPETVATSLSKTAASFKVTQRTRSF